jgi:hypothetical protein
LQNQWTVKDMDDVTSKYIIKKPGAIEEREINHRSAFFEKAI